MPVRAMLNKIFDFVILFKSADRILLPQYISVRPSVSGLYILMNLNRFLKS